MACRRFFDFCLNHMWQGGVKVSLNTTARTLWMADETIEFNNPLSQAPCHLSSHTKYPKMIVYLVVVFLCVHNYM